MTPLQQDHTQRIRIQARTSTPRCCACREDILDPRQQSKMVACFQCGITAHAICQHLLENCPNLGCNGWLTPSKPKQQNLKALITTTLLVPTTFLLLAALNATLPHLLDNLILLLARLVLGDGC